MMDPRECCGTTPDCNHLDNCPRTNPVAVTAETLEELFAVHRIARARRDLYTHCMCGWQSSRARLTDFSATHAEQHAAHLVSVVRGFYADTITNERAEAWDEGYVARFKNPGGTPNPYRLDAAASGSCPSNWCGPWKDGLCVDCGNPRPDSDTEPPA